MHRDVRHEELEWILMEGDELASVKNYEHKDKPYFGDAALHCSLCQHHIGDAKKFPDIRMHLACMYVFSAPLEVHSCSNMFTVIKSLQTRPNKVHTTSLTLTQYLLQLLRWIVTARYQHMWTIPDPSYYHESSIQHFQSHWW